MHLSHPLWHLNFRKVNNDSKQDSQGFCMVATAVSIQVSLEMLRSHNWVIFNDKGFVAMQKRIYSFKETGLCNEDLTTLQLHNKGLATSQLRDEDFLTRS